MRIASAQALEAGFRKARSPAETLVSIPEPSPCGCFFTLRFARPLRVLPSATDPFGSWYPRALTDEYPSLAAQIRALAEERGYYTLDDDAKREMRRALALELRTRIQNVVGALAKDPRNQGRGGGRPREPHIQRCPACQQALRNDAARLALQQVVVSKRKR